MEMRAPAVCHALWDGECAALLEAYLSLATVSLAMSRARRRWLADIRARRVRILLQPWLTSVCGEPCNLQACTACASPAQLDQMVDLATPQPTLRDTLKNDPLVRLITLSCGHIFTVETLDAHMGLSAYYTNVGGKWCSLLTPAGYQERKTCPSCLASISSPRYGRATKRALLGLQEKVAVMRFTTTLQAIKADVNAIRDKRARAQVKQQVRQLLNNVVPSCTTKLDGKRMVAELGTFTDQMIHCISAKAFACEKQNLFGITGVLGVAWRQAANRHLKLYASLVNIVNQTRLPHNVAYQSAISSIYFKELELARESSISVTHEPKKAALLMARRRVGAPPPGGQAVFSTNALALTIEVRLTMVGVADAFVDFLWDGGSVGRFKGPEALKQAREAITASRTGAVAFQRLATGLLLSCTRDAQVMIGLAAKWDLPRFVLQGHFLWLTVAAELTRYKSLWAFRPTLKRPVDESTDREAKFDMVKRSVNERKQCTERFLKTLRVLSLEQKKNEPFLAELNNVRGFAKQIMDDWLKLENQLLAGQWRQEVSREKQEAVARAVLSREYGVWRA